jgi:hypothetical protein
MPSNNKIRLIGEAGFDKMDILSLGLCCANHYFPEDTTCAVLFRVDVLRTLLKFNRLPFEKTAILFGGGGAGPLCNVVRQHRVARLTCRLVLES